MSLPLVLAGPIVRRVDEKSATFWMALSESAVVEAWVWAGDQVSTGDATVQSGDAFIAHSSAAGTQKWGEQLHTVTVTAPLVPAALLPPGTLCAYDITIAGHGGLKALGLLADAAPAGSGTAAADLGRLALGYLTDRLPTFVPPPATIPDLRFAHSSCRKPHGYGPDALPWLDDVVKDNRTSPEKRPQQLFLTGDQIYADDVTASLLGILTPLAGELMGFDETVPMAGGAAGNTDARVQVKALPPMRRGRLSAEVAKLSTTDSACHLMGFGEFAAMYLACWSPAVWRALPGRDEIFTGQQATDIAQWHLTDFETAFGDAAGWKKQDDEDAKSERGYAAEALRVTAFARTVPKVARLLANCATYMIFDDHDVTDDWYLSAPWRTRVLTSPLGRTVVRNAMMAYCVFQAPGNDPEKWNDPAILVAPETPEHAVLGQIVTLLGDRVTPTQGHQDDVDGHLGLVNPTSAGDIRFHYTVNGPRHRVVVLDTRTRRTYDSATRESPPKLLGDSLDAMLPAGPMTDGREVLVVVSAAPTLFPRIFDALIQPAAASVFDVQTHYKRTEAFDPARPKPAIVGSEQWDLEGWGSNESAFHTFLRRLATYPRVVVLGGDVHFASSLLCDLWTKGDDIADSRILQCTSSAAHNQPTASQRAVLRSQRSAQRLLQATPLERLGWDGDQGVVLPAGAHIAPGRRGRLRAKPTFLPAHGWPAGTTVAADKPPDVRYRVAVLRDERSSAEMGPDAPNMPTLPAFDASDKIATYARVAGSHQQLLQGGKDPIRLLVFASNVGVLSFAGSPAGVGEYVATHALMSPVGDGTTGAPLTHHSADLARTAAAAPPVLVAGD